MHWKDTDKKVFFFSYNIIVDNIKDNTNYDPMQLRNYYSYMHSKGYIYPKKDLSVISKLETKTIKPGSTLYFDAGSGFPRFKLSMSDNKRCIKVAKGDYIVVSGERSCQCPPYEYVVIEDLSNIYLVRDEEYTMWCNDSLSYFESICSNYHTFDGSLHIIYRGYLASYTKESVYMAKYLDGQYTKPFITDVQLDKIICEMCPEPTYEEFNSVLDMLNSEDSSVVQLGVKMLTGYNVEKYKLSMRLILLTRRNWYIFTRNTVGTKQLMETLNIDQYQIRDDIFSTAWNIQKGNEVYTIEDIAIAKKLSSKIIAKSLQDSLNKSLFGHDYQWLPDERRVKLD